MLRFSNNREVQTCEMFEGLRRVLLDVARLMQMGTAAFKASMPKVQTGFAPTSGGLSFYERAAGGHAKKLRSTEGALGCECLSSSRKVGKKQTWPPSTRPGDEGHQQGVEGSDRSARGTVNFDTGH